MTMNFNKTLLAGISLLLSVTVMAQDPAIAGIDKSKSPIAVNEKAIIQADFLNGSSTAFASTTQVQWIINIPPAIEYKGTYSFDDGTAASYVDVTYTPYNATDGQIIFITSRPGIAFPGNAAYTISIEITGKIASQSNQPFSIQAESTPAVGTNNNGNDNVASSISTSSTIISLPVKLISFTAQTPDNKTADLQWITATERNTDYFEVLRAADGTNFNVIGKIAAKGNSTIENKYVLKDADPVPGVNYYRLKMVDKDGGVDYSNINKLSFGILRNGLAVYPNPAGSIIHIKSGQGKVLLTNSNGMTVIQEKFTDGSLLMSIHQLAAGTYFVHFIPADGSQPVYQKIQVVK
jgi:hypothetical protein